MLTAVHRNDIVVITVTNLGKELKKYREYYQLTVRELAELTGVSYSFISKYENGKRDPSLTFLYRLQHRVFDLPPFEFRNLLDLSKEKSTDYVCVVEGDQVKFIWDVENNVEDIIVDYYSIEGREGGEFFYGQSK